MKRISLISAIAIVGALAPVAALAADSSSGCGLGWHVTSSTSLSATTTRGTTHASLPSTFSMTSGTAGCAKHPIAKNDMPAFEYALANHEALSIEMARGSGESLAAFARTMGCGDSQLSAFGQMTQRRYSDIVQGGEVAPVDLFDNVKAQVQADPVLSLSCRT